MKKIFSLVVLIAVIVGAVFATTPVKARVGYPANPCAVIIPSSVAGVQAYKTINGQLNVLAVTGTNGEAVLISPKDVVSFANGNSVNLLLEYRGAKSIGVRGWIMKDAGGKTVATGAIGFTASTPTLVCKKTGW